MRTTIRRVAVIGAGTIGTGWAAFFASRGLVVHFFDTAFGVAQAAAENVAAIIQLLTEHGLLSQTKGFRRTQPNLHRMCSDRVNPSGTPLVDALTLRQPAVEIAPDLLCTQGVRGSNPLVSTS